MRTLVPAHPTVPVRVQIVDDGPLVAWSTLAAFAVLIAAAVGGALFLYRRL